MKPEEHHRTSVLIAALPPWSPTSPVRVARFLLTGRWQVVHAYGIITCLSCGVHVTNHSRGKRGYYKAAKEANI